tara:strand:- start:2069 stop:2323 length:255 start_codon:yes stop_codon:yes gene_type:complete
MRTTLDKRLNAEVLQAFAKERIANHGLIIDTIMHELSHCHYWQDMSIRTMRNTYLFGGVDRNGLDYMTIYWGDTRLFTPEEDLI